MVEDIQKAFKLWRAAHNTDADVEVTIDLTEFYIRKTRQNVSNQNCIKSYLKSLGNTSE